MPTTNSLTPLVLLTGLASAAAAQQPPEPAPGPESAPAEARGTKLRTAAASPGLTLLAPLQSTSTYLVDLDGKVAHEWKSDAPPGQSVYLRENGHLLRAERVESDTFWGGGQGGRVRELDADGKLVWEYVCADATRLQHHDFKLLTNGHLLLIAWEKKSGAEALAAGRDPALLVGDELWPDMLLEIELTPPSGGTIVWEWHAWDHLVQDRDPKLPNHARVSEHPERVDVNADREPRDEEAEAKEMDDLRALGYAGEAPEPKERERRGPPRGGDWLHVNAVDYQPELDVIALSSHSLSEVWVIDHSTTLAESRSHAGGRYGRGGDLLARFGNPRMHGAGTTKDQFLFNQHNAQWIAPGLPGAGHLLVFNNGFRGFESEDAVSAVEEFALPLDLASVTKGLPTATRVWTYANPDILSSHISGAQRLANGDTLICAGESGRVREVTPRGEVVWDFLSPFRGDLPPRGGRGPGGPGGAGGPPGFGGPRPDGPRPDGPPPGEGPDGGPRRRGPGGFGGPRGGPGGMDTGLFRAPRYALDYAGVVALREKPAER